MWVYECPNHKFALGFALQWMLEKLYRRQVFSLLWILWCHTTVPIKKSTNHETIMGLCYILCSSNSRFSCKVGKADREIHSSPIAPGRQKNRWSFTRWDNYFFFPGKVGSLNSYIVWWLLVTAGAVSAAWQIFQVTFPTESWQVECETHFSLRLHCIRANTLSQPCTSAVQEHQ